MGKRKQAPWVIQFFRTLVRTGDVRGAALDTGIDELTAYEWRMADPHFADLWRAALRAHEYWEALQNAGGLPLSRLACGESALPRNGGRG